ncbi:MAG: FkbM family methyltransferase [bacterium]
MLKFIIRSLRLDYSFLKLSLPLWQKLSFICKKYFLLCKNVLFGIQPGITNVKIFGVNYYYDEIFGLAFLQSVFVDNSFLHKCIAPNSVIVDIGANIGQFNLFAKIYLHAKTVYSIEPMSKSFSLLQLNAKKDIFNCAVATKQSFEMYLPKETSLVASVFLHPRNDSSGAVAYNVSGRRLSQISEINNEPHIDLLKIDVEGTEYDVFVASSEIIAKSRYLILEISVDRPSDGNFLSVMGLLQQIAPQLKLISVGRIFKETEIIEAVDLLFVNQAVD